MLLSCTVWAFPARDHRGSRPGATSADVTVDGVGVREHGLTDVVEPAQRPTTNGKL